MGFRAGGAGAVSSPSGSGSGLGVPRIRLELNSETLVIRWNREDWKKVETLFLKNGLRVKERNELFKTPQPTSKFVYAYYRTPPSKRYYENGFEIDVIDDLDSKQIIDFERPYRVVINRGIFRVIPSPSDGIATIAYTTENIFIPEIKQNYQHVLKAVKTALQDLLGDLIKIKYKLIMEVY